MAFGIIVVQLLLAATVTGIQGQFQQYDGENHYVFSSHTDQIHRMSRVMMVS